MSVDLLAGLAPLEIGPRAGRVRAHLEDVDALLVSDLVGVRWLSGFTGSNGWLVLFRDQVTLVTDGRYGDQARQQMAAAGVEGTVLEGRSQAAMLELLGLASLGSRDARVRRHAHMTVALSTHG